jgi:hypothetical protein
MTRDGADRLDAILGRPAMSRDDRSVGLRAAAPTAECAARLPPLQWAASATPDRRRGRTSSAMLRAEHTPRRTLLRASLARSASVSTHARPMLATGCRGGVAGRRAGRHSLPPAEGSAGEPAVWAAHRGHPLGPGARRASAGTRTLPVRTLITTSGRTPRAWRRSRTRPGRHGVSGSGVLRGGSCPRRGGVRGRRAPLRSQRPWTTATLRSAESSRGRRGRHAGSAGQGLTVMVPVMVAGW